jgi:hypothetical protein
MGDSLREAYTRVMGKVWRGYDYRNVPQSYVQARQACKAIWAMHFPKRKFPYECVRTSGNRDTWVRSVMHPPKRGRTRNRRIQTLFINPEQPWSEINHTWSHWCSYRDGNPKQHCDRHLEMERLGAELLKRRYIRS